MLAACGGNPKAKVEPPAPPMPPGVTWGAPGVLIVSPSAPAAPPRASTRLPPAPTAHPPMPAGNLSTDYRVGEVFDTGIASFYGPREQGNETASGEIFDYHKMTAAHRLLPLGTRVKVTDLKTSKSVEVRINDRGPFWPNRLLDLSWGAAQKIGDDGLDPVRIEIVSLPDPIPTGVYTVMVGWFTQDDPLAQCRNWMQQRLDKPVITLPSDEGRWLRYAKSVRLDPETATAIVRELREKQYQAYLVRLN
ncbi:MAG TPA: septal ring lytic transglycosylase RlpA family protein [Terriglobales bacterium]|nr:septal ring lytic transglycosylase RlpA family protein [Terriglobales bacterium]